MFLVWLICVIILFWCEISVSRLWLIWFILVWRLLMLCCWVIGSSVGKLFDIVLFWG